MLLYFPSPHKTLQCFFYLFYSILFKVNIVTYQIFVDLNPFFSNQNTDFPGKKLVDGKTFLTDLINSINNYTTEQIY